LINLFAAGKDIHNYQQLERSATVSTLAVTNPRQVTFREMSELRAANI
jgi:hypothetical protein